VQQRNKPLPIDVSDQLAVADIAETALSTKNKAYLGVPLVASRKATFDATCKTQMLFGTQMQMYVAPISRRQMLALSPIAISI